MSVLPPNPNEAILASLFEGKGWAVDREPQVGSGQPGLVVRKGRNAYVVEAKASSEGRGDRILPLLSQAILQAQAYARHIVGVRPLAVVLVGNASESLIARVQKFSQRYAPGIAVGLVSKSGARSFLGDGLDELNADSLPDVKRKKIQSPPSNIFSDINQWMLKVLLAPEIPEHMLGAPRKKIRNASELADVADVSVMSAFRLVQRLREEAFLHEASSHFKLVRRAELFRRWQAAAFRSPHEVAMRLLIPGAIEKQIKDLLGRHQACLGLFAAAEKMHLGHVHGIPPYVYVHKLPSPGEHPWKELVPPSPGEKVHLILRQAHAPKSVFRGAVIADGVSVSDVVQIWLDVSAHPSRGEEQANLIYQKVLGPIVEGVGH